MGNNFQERLASAMGRKKLLEEQKVFLLKERSKAKKIYKNLIKARWVLTEVTKLTQEMFKEKVESLITMAIRTVFKRDFVFELIMERKRNRFECRPVVKENGCEFDLKFDRGGGLIDIISFVFRVVNWNMEKPRSRNVFFLDEPFRFIGKGKMLARVGEMLKKISDKLNFQVIMVTHDVEFKKLADKVFYVGRNKGVSSIRCDE